MTKTVFVQSGTSFKSLSAAKEHYSKIRVATEVEAKLSELERSDILDIYYRYCVATNWEPKDVVDVVVDWDNRPRDMGQHAQTKAFHIITRTGDKEVFSIDRALKEIAT